MKASKRIVDALADYYHNIDKARFYLDQANMAKQEVLALARNGRYGRFTVGRVEKKEIKVKAYVRHGYRYIRRGKEL